MNQYETAIRLRDVAKVISGYAFSSADFQKSGVAVIKIANVRLGHVDLSDTQFVDPSFLRLDAKYHVKRGDILISLTGSHLTQPNSVVGRVALFRHSISHCLLNQRAGKIIIKQPDRCDARFLFYVLSTPEKLRTIAAMAQGAASQANVSPTQVESVEIDLPHILTQRRIASVLSAYDDLIENNTRRIKILEDMAQMLYREWFVTFRFPGHEKVQMVDSALGLIPQGWSVRSLRDVTSYISRGISPKYDESAKGWVINQKCIRDHRLLLGPARKQSKAVPSEKVVRKGDILINSTGVGTLGRVAQVHDELSNFTVDSHVSIVRPIQYAGFFGEVALQLEPSLEAMGVGSTGQTELGRERIAGTVFVYPPEALQATFSDHATSIHQLSSCLLRKNETLRITRDYLLPKLISGEIPVEAAEETTAELMEEIAQPA